MNKQAEEYIREYMSDEEWYEWIGANEGDEDLVMAAQINQWQEDAEDEDGEPVPEEIYEWAQSITTSTRV